MPRYALIDGHRCRTVGIDLGVLRAQQAQTVRRRTARHVRLKCRAAEIRICRGGHAQHGIIFGHACGYVECEPLEIRDALRRDVLCFTHDERIVRAGHVCCCSNAAIKPDAGKVGRARNFKRVAPYSRRRMRGAVRNCTCGIDRRFVGAAADVHRIVLCDGICCIIARPCLGIAAVDVGFRGDALGDFLFFETSCGQCDGVVARRCRRCSRKCGCCGSAAVDTLPDGVFGRAQGDAVPVCRCRHAACAHDELCCAARDIASVFIAAALDRDRVLVCCRAARRADRVGIGRAADERTVDFARIVAQCDRVVVRGSVRPAPVVYDGTRAAAVGGESLSERTVCDADVVVCGRCRGGGVCRCDHARAALRNPRIPAARADDIVVVCCCRRRADGICCEFDAGGGGTIHGAAVYRHCISVRLGSKGRARLRRSLLDGRRIELTLLTALRTDRDAVPVRTVCAEALLRLLNENSAAVYVGFITRDGYGMMILRDRFRMCRCAPERQPCRNQCAKRALSPAPFHKMTPFTHLVHQNTNLVNEILPFLLITHFTGYVNRTKGSCYIRLTKKFTDIVGVMLKGR